MMSTVEGQTLRRNSANCGLLTISGTAIRSLAQCAGDAINVIANCQSVNTRGDVFLALCCYGS
jgi:hypothetical protein